jgi:uncharacterized protein (TIGR00725 family)
VSIIFNLNGWLRANNYSRAHILIYAWQAYKRHGKVRYMPTLPLTRLRANRSSHALLPAAYTIGVSGVEDANCLQATKESAIHIGQELARRNQIVAVSAVSGVPFMVAEAAKAEGGKVIGFSSSISQKEHIHTHRLSTELYDAVIYVGSNYDSRNTLLLRSCQAIIFISGRSQLLPEFIESFEEEKVVAVLTRPETATDEIAHIIALVKRGTSGIIYESDPKIIIDRVILAIQQRQLKTMRTV